MGSTLELTYGEGSIAAYLGEPEGSAPFPALVVLQEWWGLNAHIREVTDRLAAEGYLALAPDLYDGNVTDQAAGAERLMSIYGDEAPPKVLAAYDALAARGDVKKIGSIGWCMGGRMSLHMAINRPKLNACVVFYGRPENYLGKLENVRSPLLGFFGELDKSIPLARVEQLDKELHEAAVAHDVIVYPGADHAFFNDQGHSYDAEAAQDAWRRTLLFLGEHLR